MPGPRTHFAMGLVLLLLCALSDCSGSAPSGASPTGYARQQQQQQQLQEERDEYRRLVEAVRRVEETRTRSGSRRESRLSSRSRVAALEARDFRSSRTDREQAVFPQNLKKKGKFLQHIAGPLYFSQKCRKHAYRLYHQTRDCTKPAYFKRCARLLTRLAGSQQCLEG